MELFWFKVKGKVYKGCQYVNNEEARKIDPTTFPPDGFVPGDFEVTYTFDFKVGLEMIKSEIGIIGTNGITGKVNGKEFKKN